MKEKIIEYFKQNKQSMLEDIASLVAIESVRGEAQESRPYGEMPYRALTAALELAESFGFETHNHEGYVGTVELNSGEAELGILAHLDVVPAGNGWHTEPFKMQILPDRIVGRGTSDDKGAAVAALYAMKAVRDLEIPVTKNCRLILGTDEECGSSDLKYYLSKEKPPKHSFTPDAEFPVTNGEKGRFTKKFFAELDLESDKKRITSFYAGSVANAVPDFAVIQTMGVSDGELEAAARLAADTEAKFTVKDGQITVTGVSSHASLPESGNNPITAAFEMLKHVDFGKNTLKFVASMNEMFPHGGYRGEGFGVEMSDKLGMLTLSLDIIDFDGKSFTGCFDTRTPLCASKENCAEKIAEKLAENGFTIENTDMVNPHYVDENSEFIKTLLSAYELYSGEKGECVCTGGGTYVHDIEGGVAFGAIGRETNTNMHGADEFMLIDELVTAAEIFTAVIAEMCK